jgi:hypothetical protein
MIIEENTDTITQINSEIDKSAASGKIVLTADEWEDFYKYILDVHGCFNKQAYSNVKKELDTLTYSYRGFDIRKEIL